MPKKPTGYAKSGKGKSSPLNKEAAPDKTPELKANTLPVRAGGSTPKGPPFKDNPLPVGSKIPKGMVPLPMDGGPNKVASMPSTVRNPYPKLTRPPKLAPRKPTI